MPIPFLSDISGKNAIFAGDVTTSGNIILSGASNEIIKSNGSIRLNIDSDANQTDRVFIVSTGANSELFKVDESGNGTFTGDITVNGGDAVIKKASYPGGVLTLGRELSNSGGMTSALIQFQAYGNNTTLRTFGKIEGRSNGYNGGSIYLYTQNAGTETQALLIDENQSAYFAGAGTFETTLNVDATDGGGAPAMTAVINMKGYDQRGVGIKMKDNVNTSAGGTDAEWFVGTGYNSTGFNIGYASDGSQSSYPAQAKLSITTSGNATFAGAVEVNGNLVVDGAGVSTDFQLRRSVNAAALLTINAPGGSPNGSVFSINGNSVMTLDANQDATFSGDVLINQSSNLTSQALQVNGFIDITDVTGTALRWYNGSTFRGGLGLDDWAHSGSAADTTMYIAGDNSFFVSTNNVKRLEINSSGATFAGNVTVGGTTLNLSGTSYNYITSAANVDIGVSSSAHNVAGYTTLLYAGSPTAGTTNNIAGGSLYLAGGAGKGTGAGGDIIFRVAPAGSSGSSVNAYTTALTISDDKSATFAGDARFNQRVRIGDVTGLSNRGAVRIDTRGDAPADLLFGRDTAGTATSWDGVYWALSSRNSGQGDKFTIYRGAGHASPYNSEAIPFQIEPNLNATFAGTIQSDDITIVDGINDVNLYLGNTSYGIQLDYSAGDMFFRTNGATRLTIANGGNATFAGDGTFNGSLNIGKSLHIGPSQSRYIFNSDTVNVAGSGTSNAGAIEWKEGTHYIPSVAYAFKVRLVTTGTGTDTGANYIVYYNNTTPSWVVRHVSLAGNDSNHPLLTMVSDGTGTYMGAYDNHSGTYNIRYFVESWDTGDQDMDGHAFGSDFHWQRLNDTLTYPDGDVAVTNNISANNLSGTNTGDQDLSAYITQTNADARYVLETGGSSSAMTGDLHIIAGAPKIYLQDNTDDDDQQIIFRNNGGSDEYKIATQDFTSGGGGDGFYIGSTTSDGELALVTANTTALTLDTSQNANFASDVTITGNLTVGGTTTIINTSTVEVKDNILQLNTTQGTPDTATATTSGISIYRGVDGSNNPITQASFIFDDADDTWDLTDSLEVATNISLGYAIKHVGDTGTNIIFSTGQILLETSTNGNYINVHNNGINYYNASSHSFTGSITCNNKITADLGFTSHNQRGHNASPHTTEEYPLGHYTGGKEIWSLDTTWSNSQLQEYFNSSNVEWYEDSTAPAGYSIKIDGSVSTGGYYGSGFPYIPIEEGSIYLIEVYIRNEAGSSIGHYMGTQDFEHDFTSLASGSGNPGSYGYHLMSNHNPGTDWQHRYAFVSGHHNTDVGKFETGAKYFTPHSLFNYSHSSGTRRCYISGWRVTRIAEQEFFAQGTAAKPAIVLHDGVYNSVPNSGLYREWYDGATATKDQISVSTDGTRRLRINEAGIWTDQNFYVSGDWRTFSSVWDASAGTSGAGFRFQNTHTDTNGVVALTISATGNGVFGGTLESEGSITAKGATIKSPAGSGQDTVIDLTGTNTSGFGSSYAIKSQIKSIAVGSANAYASKLIFSTNNTSNLLMPGLQIDENQDVEVYGNIKHTGLTMSSGVDVDQYKYFAMTFQLSANTWTDTGIDGTDLATGVYAMQVYVSDFNVGGNHYYEYYSGMVTWYSDQTNSTMVDEIPTHRAGHAPNNGDIQFRTQRASSTDTHDLMLQVKHNRDYTGALDDSNGGKIMRFKFRRLI